MVFQCFFTNSYVIICPFLFAPIRPMTEIESWERIFELSKVQPRYLEIRMSLRLNHRITYIVTGFIQTYLITSPFLWILSFHYPASPCLLRMGYCYNSTERTSARPYVRASGNIFHSKWYFCCFGMIIWVVHDNIFTFWKKWFSRPTTPFFRPLT